MNIILSGGGEAKDSKEMDELLISLIPKGKSLLYIPIAMPEEEHPYPECYNWLKSVLTPLNFTNIVMWTDLKDKELKDLDDFGAIYIGGGNTFSLLHNLRQAKFDKILFKFIKKGGLVYGGSAGAIILGKDIITASHEDKNDVQLKDTSGFDFVKGYSIWPHYKEEHDKEIFEFIKKYNLKIIALTNATGLFVEDSKIKLIGSKEGFLFEKDKKELIELDSIIS